MLAIAYWMAFTACGWAAVRFLLPEKSPLIRGWLGAALGLALEMWLPALCAFSLNFSLPAHGAALGLLALLTGGAYLGRSKKQAAEWTKEDTRLAWLLLIIALPLTLVGGILQWTHNIMPAADGSLHVGQSTYGDLPLHLSIISGLRNAPFPPDYSILPGARLSYPFLTDSLSTSFLLLGFDLRAAVVFPGILMTALTVSGYVLLAARLAETKKGAALAALLFFLNGGLGFFYLLDMRGTVLGASGSNELQSVPGVLERIRLVLNGWYQTPANHAEFTTYNLRWSNVMVDMMVPQRTTLGGWTQVLPCLYLLYDALRPAAPALPKAPGDGPTAVLIKRETPWRQMILLGAWAGMLPMVNTHCFLALFLCSAGWMAWDLIENRKRFRSAVQPWLAYGGLAAALALPQLFTWTFRQSLGSEQFLQFRFNWVNGELGMLDGYFWFYMKNIGLPFLLILLALLEKNKKRRFLAVGAFLIYLPAELIQFQPNPYDNNKLFYIWYMLCCPMAADYAGELFRKLRGLRARYVLAGLTAVCFFFTGVLAVAREIRSDYQMFSRADVEAAAMVEECAGENEVFLTGDQHINFVSSLAGRRIVCGPDLWLYWHGLKEITEERHRDVRRFYEDPANNTDVLEKYGVDYILVSDHERYAYAVNEEALEEEYPLFYCQDGISIYGAEPADVTPGG